LSDQQTSCNEKAMNGKSCLIIWMTCNVGCTGNAWPAIGHMNCKSRSFVLCVRFLEVTGEFEVIAQLQLLNQIFQKIHKKLKLNAKLIWNSWRCCNLTQPNSFDARFETKLKLIAVGDCASEAKLTGIHLVTGHKCLKWLFFSTWDTHCSPHMPQFVAFIALQLAHPVELGKASLKSCVVVHHIADTKLVTLTVRQQHNCILNGCQAIVLLC